MSRTVRALLAVLALGAFLPLSAASAQQPATPRLDVLTQTPVVAPEGSFILSLDVVGAPPGARLETTLYKDPVRDRAQFNRTLFFEDLGDRRAGISNVDVDELAPSGTRRRRADIGISLVKDAGPNYVRLEDGLVGAGAFPLDVQLVSEDGDLLARLVTHLVRLAKEGDDVQPLRAAMVFDLHAPPSVDPFGRSKIDPDALDQIARITEALRSHPDAPVTLDATPETIEALARAEGRPRAVLERLQAVLPRKQLVDRPYVDVPVSSWIAANMRDELNRQRGRGNAVLTEQLKRPDRTTWVSSGDLTAEAAAELWEGGFTRFVLPEGSFAARPTDEDEPTSARPFELATRVDAPVQAVGLDTSLGAALGRGTDPELGAVQLLAQLAVIQGEAPDQARGVVFGPSPGTPVAPRLIKQTMELIQGDPLVRLSTVGEIFDDVAPAKDGDSVLRRDLTPSPTPDLGDYPQRLHEIRGRIDSYKLVVRESDALLASWDQRLLISGAAELDGATQRRYLDVIQATIGHRMAQIDSPARQTVTLTSRSGVIPFSVRNRLRQPVRVTLELEGGSGLELSGGADQLTADVAHGVEQIRIPVRARSPGVVPVTVRVTSPDGGLLISSSRVTVRSTAVSGIGFVLTVGAAGFLVIWWVRHWRRSRREVTAPPPAGS